MKGPIDRSARDLFPGGVLYLSIFLLIISFALSVLLRNVWDYDFWWHIATGRYIVNTGHLPHSDPFSFTSQLPENSNLAPLREKFILTQYWLAQVLLYLLYNNFGPAGIAILRTILLIGALLIIYKALKSRGAAPHIIFLSIFLAAFGMFRFLGERPVLFTICFSVACFVMIDDYVRKRSRIFYFLPLLMLIWANLHGGFILGDAIILVFMLVEWTKLLLGRSSFAKKEMLIFFSVLFLAIGASAINPNGFLAFFIAFSHKYSPFFAGVQEYQSPLLAYKMKYFPIDYSFFAALFLFPILLILRRRKFNLTHLVLLSGLAVEGMSAVRFTVYYCLFASLILGNELDLWLKEHREKLHIRQARLNIVIAIVMAISSSLYFLGVTDYWGLTNPQAFRTRVSPWIVPKQAADLIEVSHIKGNMLNSMASGGYLAWRLYPEVKTFIDTRALNYTVMKEYSWIMETTDSAYRKHLPPGKIPLWKRLIDHYKINLIVLDPFDIYGQIIPLTTKLLDDPAWVPVSVSVPAIVFVKNIPENRRVIKMFKKSHDEVYNMMIIKASSEAKSYRQNPRYVESLGDIFVKMGRNDDALTAYQYALKRMPDDIEVKAKLDKLAKEKTEAKNKR